MDYRKTSGLPCINKAPTSSTHLLARENDRKAKEAMKASYDKNKHVSESPITVGTRVFLKLERENKATPDWDPQAFLVIATNNAIYN
jgi:hypothetical protein